MHTDLSSHLHSEKCNAAIQKYLQCHKDHPFRKFMGYCNDEDREMTKCLKEERLERRRRNAEKSKEWWARKRVKPDKVPDV